MKTILDPLTESLRKALLQPTSDGFTIVELVEKSGLSATNHSKEKIRRYVRAEITAGRLVAQMGRRPSISGHPVAVPIFLPVKK